MQSSLLMATMTVWTDRQSSFALVPNVTDPNFILHDIDVWICASQGLLVCDVTAIRRPSHRSSRQKALHQDCRATRVQIQQTSELASFPPRSAANASWDAAGEIVAAQT
jgi:hypothetical protein